MELPDVVNILKNALRRPVAYHRVFTDITGKLTAGVMLSQAYYWTPRTADEDGWFFKNRDEWQEETGLSRSEQESARKRLVTLGVLQEELRGMPGRLHFRVDMEKLVTLLAEIQPTGSRRKSRQQGGRNPANMLAGNQPAFLIDPKTTSESTTEITPMTAKATRIPEPFLLTARMRAWAATECPDVNVRKATEEFVDYWRGVAGTRGKKLDWEATWRNRMRVMQREAERHHPRNPRSPKGDSTVDAAKQAAAEFRNGTTTQ